MLNDRLDDTALKRLVLDPVWLLDEIDKSLESAPPELLPSGVLSGEDTDESGESKPYREVSDGRPRHAVLDFMLERITEPLREAACVKGNYCAVREKHSDTVDVVKTVADSMLSAVVAFPVPAATLAVYCVQSLFLDRLCKCHA